MEGYPVFRDSQGETTNPQAGDVLADTGAIGGTVSMTSTGGGVYDVEVYGAATATCEMALQVRNAANDANVGDAHVFYVGANATVRLSVPLEVEGGQRIRVVANANLTGDAVASVFAKRVG